MFLGLVLYDSEAEYLSVCYVSGFVVFAGYAYKNFVLVFSEHQGSALQIIEQNVCNLGLGLLIPLDQAFVITSGEEVAVLVHK